MAIISSFLCWSNTRTGSAVCGYYTLVISVMCLAFYMLRYIALEEMKDSIELKGIVYAGFVLYSFLIGVSLILLPGVYMDRKLLLLPWIYVLVITVLYETGAVALITTVHLEQDQKLNAWEIVAVAFYCLRLIANCYCFACVVSQYQELSEGRGTYEFLYKPRRRQFGRGQNPLSSDMEEYNPPYGATLPPYSQDNPNKEFSPPLYENLAADYEEIDAETLTSHHSGGHRLRAATSASYLADILVNTPPQELDSLETDDGCDVDEFSTVSLRHIPNHGGYSTDVDGYSTVSSRHVRNPSGYSTDSTRHVRNPSGYSSASSRHVRNSSAAVSEITIADEDGGETVRYITDLRALRSARSMEELQHLPHHHHHHHHHHQHRHNHSHSVDCTEQTYHDDARQSPVTMTSSSACLLEGLSTQVSRSGLRVHGSQGSSSCPQTPHSSRPRRSRSPLSVQKRTYISWI